MLSGKQRSRVCAAFALVVVLGCTNVLAQQTIYGRPIEELCEPQDIVECDQRTNYFSDQVFQTEFIERASAVRFFNTYVSLRISKPDDNDFQYTAILLQCGCPVPQGISEENQNVHIIPVPIKSAYMYETPSIYMFAVALGQMSRLKVVKTDTFLYNTDVRTAIEDGSIRMTGGAHKLVIDEKVVGTIPALAVVALWEQLGHDDEEGSFTQQTVGKIQYIPIGEVYEASPLGRAEWIKIMALLTKTVPTSLEIFSQIKTNYNNARTAVVEKSSLRPSVVTNQLFTSFAPGESYAWFTTGKDTYTYNLLRDAGARYRLNSSQTQSLTGEEAITAFSSSRYWIGFANLEARTMDAVLAADISPGRFVYKELDAAKCSLVYSPSLRVSPKTPKGRGSDLLESGIVFPDRVLLDLTKILHPEIDTSADFFYYRQMTPSDDLVCERTVLPSEPDAGRIFVEYSISVFNVGRFQLEDLAAEMQMSLSDGLDIANFLVGLEFKVPASGASVMQRLRLMLKPSDAQPSADEVNSLLTAFLSSTYEGARVDVEKLTEDPSQSSLSGGAIAGIVIGSIVLAVLIGLVVFLVWKRSRSKRGMGAKIESDANIPVQPENTA